MKINRLLLLALFVPLVYARPSGQPPSSVTFPFLYSVASAAGTTNTTCANIMSFGGDNTNTSDNTSAFNQAVASSLSSGHVCVYAPSGTYKFNSSLTISLSSNIPISSVMIEGDGQDITNFNFFNGSNGLIINLATQYQSLHIRDLSLLAGNVSNSTLVLM